MDKTEKIEQYKLLLDIYYHEITNFYTKATIFVAIQTGILAGIVALFEKLQSNMKIFLIVIIFAIVLSCIQILISVRGNIVSNALIKTISEYEKENGYSLLKKFSDNEVRKNKILGMNSPSYLFIIINIAFLLLWTTILIVYIIIPNICFLSVNYESFINYRLFLLPILSIVFAITMKISDLLDEHGLHWFKGDALIFSILCAISGSLLIFIDDITAQMIFAMIISFVVRKRIDFFNHIIAFIILVTSYLINAKINVRWFLFFFIAVIILGCVKDLKYTAKKSKIIKVISCIYLYIPIIYAIPALLYSIITKDWIFYISFFLFDLSYNITRLIGEKDLKKYYS